MTKITESATKDKQPVYMPATMRTGQEPAQAKTLVVEWEFADEDHEWQLAQAGAPVAPAPIRRGGWRYLAVAAVALLAVVAGGWLWIQAHAGLHAVEGEIQAAVKAERWRAEYVSRRDTEPTEFADMTERKRLPEADHVQLLDLGEEWATVEVTSIQGRSAYRQTRLYRRGASGWSAAVPSAAVWGRPHTLEMDHFIFHYYARDAEAVTAAAAKLDAMYPDLVASYPIDPSSDAKHQVWVSPEVSPEHVTNRTADAALEVASPAIYLAPTELSGSDILAQAVLLELLGALASRTNASLCFAGKSPIMAAMEYGPTLSNYVQTNHPVGVQ
jgi:hypothetical protein